MTLKGLFHDKGRIKNANGEIYRWEWKVEKANGEGKFLDWSEWLNVWRRVAEWLISRKGSRTIELQQN